MQGFGKKGLIGLVSRKNLVFGLIVAALLLTASIALVVSGAGKSSDNVTINTVAYFDLQQVTANFPEFAKVKEFKETLEKELEQYRVSQNQLLAAYLDELESKKEQEMQGKTEAEKKEIEHRYEQMAQVKALEFNQNTRNKRNELQARVDAEIAKAEENMRQLIISVGTSKDQNLIMTKTAVYQGGLDLTPALLDKAAQNAKKQP